MTNRGFTRIAGGPRAVLVGLTLSALACWRPPKLPPEETAPPGEEELLRRRPYTVQVPTNESDAQTWPLIISLHGYAGSGAETAEYLQLPAHLSTRAFFVAPDGATDRLGNSAWDPDPTHSAPWDVEYLLAIVHDLKAKHRIDESRVFFVGHSQGAHMAHRMACDASAEVAAIVSLAGQVSTVEGECSPSHPVSVLDLHGDLDAVIGYEGDTQNDPPDPRIPSAHQTLAVWGGNNGCGELTTAPEALDLDTSLEGNETLVERYAGCPDGIEVALWTIRGAGHRPRFGPNLPTLITDFLLGHPRVNP